jgi:hypothetical protein
VELADLVENGREVYGWRLVLGEPAFVVVELAFTIAGQDGEGFDAFKARMLGSRPVLEQGKRHWAEFVCRTPATGFPVLESEPQHAA